MTSHNKYILQNYGAGVPPVQAKCWNQPRLYYNLTLFICLPSNILNKLLCGIFFLSLLACQAQTRNVAEGDALPTRRELSRAFRDNHPYLIVYGNQNPAYGNKYRAVAEEVQAFLSDRKVMIKADDEVLPHELSENILFLVGTASSNQVIAELSENLPVKLEKNSFTFAGNSYSDSASVFLLPVYPNPLATSLPVSLLTGTSDATLSFVYAHQWQSLLRERWGYAIYQDGKRRVMGLFSDSLWQVDPSVHFDFGSSGKVVKETPHFRFTIHQVSLPTSEIETIARACENYTRSIDNFLGFRDLQKIDYHIYPSTEVKGLMTGNTNQGHVDFEKYAVHTVINEEFTGNFIAKEGELIIRHALGKPQINALEQGLAISFTHAWQKKGYQYWAQRLFQSGNMLSLTDLLNDEMWQKESYLITGCLAATFTDFLVQYWGKDVFLEKYEHWQPTAQEITTLEKHWHVHLAEQTEAFSMTTPNAPKSLPYCEGFNFTHEGYQIYNGYNSERATVSLQKLHTLGSNAVALVPYSFMRNPKSPSYLPINRSAHGENDEGVIHSAFEAKRRGMVTMLKPQVWIRGGWPGDVAMQTEADWQAFFEYYYRWIRHYALLAEMYNFDIFCIGVEFNKATLAREDDWRQMINKIRKLYSGKLVYAANWGEEFENITFWDELDYIGIDCYYPLSKNTNPTDRELKNNFEKILGKIEDVSAKYDKQVFFTEIGFRSVAGTWENPHAEAGDRASNVQHQARAYEVVLQSLQNEPWCAGLFWWKWPTDLEDSNATDRRFIPAGKPAEEVVGKWFGR